MYIEKVFFNKTCLSELKNIYSFSLVSALAGSQVVNKNEPTFVSRSEAFKFAVGDVITLPCEVRKAKKNWFWGGNS